MLGVFITIWAALEVVGMNFRNTVYVFIISFRLLLHSQQLYRAVAAVIFTKLQFWLWYSRTWTWMGWQTNIYIRHWLNYIACYRLPLWLYDLLQKKTFAYCQEQCVGVGGFIDGNTRGRWRRRQCTMFSYQYCSFQLIAICKPCYMLLVYTGWWSLKHCQQSG